MLLNLSNHPSSSWTEEQIKAAECFGKVVDLAFPVLNPKGDENYIDQMATKYLGKVKAIAKGQSITVHVMGEMTFTLALVSKLSREGIECIASTTERVVNDFGNGQKQATFRFVRFRKYIQ